MTTTIEFPRFNEARGETASMQLIPPFQFTGVTMRVFPLRANRYLVQRFIDNQLNIIPPAAGQFRVFLPYIYLIVVNYGKMAVTAANLGWISQNEVAFSIPMIWQHEVEGRLVQDFAFVSPFIYVDNPLSMTTGREVYGWPKGMAGFDPQLSAWMSNPMNRMQQTAMSVDVVREAYAGGRSHNAVLLEIDSAPYPSIGQFPPDVRNPLMPWNALRKSVYSASALTGDSFEILRGLVEAFSGPSDRQASLDQMQRLARHPGDLAVLNTVNLKQFRDADDPDDFAYQSITNTPMTIRSYRRGGMLGDMRMMAGDVTGGYMVRVHEYDTQPIVSMLGLEVASVSEIEGAAVTNLAPVFPFWLEVDLDYPLASVLAWRQKGGPGWIHGDRISPALPSTDGSDHLYNTTSGAITQEVAGPFEYPNATVRVMPLAAEQAKLQAFLDEYLNATLAGTDERFVAWGHHVYMVVLSDEDTFSLSNDIGDLASRGASFEIPVKRYQGDRLIGTAIVPAYVFANSATGAMSERGVNGIPAMAAKLTSPANSWLEPRGPSPDANDRLLTIRGDVLPVVGQGQEAKSRTIVQCDTREPVGHDDDAGWQRLAGSWVPPLKHELERKRVVEPLQLARLKALALELLANQAPFNRVTLKQFRSASDPTRACYQALVNVPLVVQRLFELEEIESDLHVRLHEYPSQAIVGKLGLIVKAWERGSGCQVAVLEPVRPFWFRAQMREELGQNLFVWSPAAGETGHWVRGREWPSRLEGSALSELVVRTIDDGDPRRLADHVRPFASCGALGMDGATIRAAIEQVDPQIAIESILSCEWEAWHDPRWLRGRGSITDRLDEATEGAFPSEVTTTTAEQLEQIHTELGDPKLRREWEFKVHRLREVDAELHEYRELSDRLARVQAAEEELRSIDADRDGDGKPDVGKKTKTRSRARERLESASEELFSHMLELRDEARQRETLEPLLAIMQESFAGFGGAFGRDLQDIGDDTRSELVRNLRRAMMALRERIIHKLSKSWQKPDHCVRRQTILRVTNDHFPQELSYDQYWYAGAPTLARARRPATIPAHIVVHATRLLGVAPNHELLVHEPGMVPFWRPLPGSGAVTDVVVTPDGHVLGIGMDHAIWMRDHLHAPWHPVAGTQAIKALARAPEGTLIAAGLDGDLYTRAQLDQPWQHVPDSGHVVGITSLGEGKVVVAGSAGDLCVREHADAGPWRQVDATLVITKVVALPGGQLVAVGPDQQLYARDTLEGVPWQGVDDSGPVIALALLHG